MTSTGFGALADNPFWANLGLPARLQVARELPAAEAWALLAPAVGPWRQWDWAVVRELQGRVEEAGPALPALWLASDSPWRDSPAGKWLLAEAWTRSGRRAEALTLWNEIVAAGGPTRSDALLARARLQRDLGNRADAYADLRAAAGSSSDYALRMKISRLFERVAGEGGTTGRPVRIALLFSSSADLIAPLLRLACFRAGLNATLYVAPYGNHRQEALDPSSGLHRSAPDFVIVGTHWRDAHAETLGAEADSGDRLWAESREIWDAIQARHPCVILQHAFDLPGSESAGFLASAESGGRRRLLRAHNARLWQDRPAHVLVVDTERLAAEAGLAAWHDSAQWFLTKQHPGPAAIPRLVDHYVALIRARLGMMKKVLVLDLDNTLWGGVVGEEGARGIQVGPPSAVGEAHAHFQTYVRELKARGVLLAVCSKNNPADARAPFREHDGMVLKEEDFAVFLANWNDKPDSIREVARQLNLGLDSFVFVDDNPVERERMRQEVPEVEVLELPLEPSGYVECLQSSGWFESVALSAEDLRRHAQYQANTQRAELQGSATSLDDFLRKLGMKMHHGSITEAVLDRVTQLLGKTNQFNLTTQRHSAEQVRAIMREPGAWTQYFRLTDCYGDNGIVGLAILRPAVGEAGVGEIDTLLMSCRVIGRRAEDFMVGALLKAATAAGYTTVRGVYAPTAKNAIVADLFPRLGFAPDAAYRGPGTAFLWHAGQPVPDAAFIEPVAAGQAENLLAPAS